MTKRMVHVLALLLVGLLFASSAEAGGAGVAAKAARRGIARSLGKDIKGVWKRDFLRDRRAPVRVLQHPRTVSRYVPAWRARFEARRGIPAGRHFTSSATGRPLGQLHAQRRFGIHKPARVLHVRLPKGQPVKYGKALGGEPGFGEIRPASRIPASAIQRVITLRRGRR